MSFSSEKRHFPVQSVTLQKDKKKTSRTEGHTEYVISLTHPEERRAGEKDREEVDAEHHLELVDLVLLEDAVLPLRGKAIARQVHRNEEKSQPLRALFFGRPAALREGEHAHSEGNGNRLQVDIVSHTRCRSCSVLTAFCVTKPPKIQTCQW